MTGEHRQLAGRGVLLVFCHIHNTGTRRLEVRDAENLAIHLEDGGEVRVVGDQVNLQSTDDETVSRVSTCCTALLRHAMVAAKALVISPFPCRRRHRTPLRRCRPAGQ